MTFDSSIDLFSFDILAEFVCEVVVFKLYFVIRVPDVISLYDGQTNVVSDFVGRVIDSEGLLLDRSLFAFGVAFGYWVSTLNDATLNSFFHTFCKFVLYLCDVNFSLFDWLLNFVGELFLSHRVYEGQKSAHY